MAAASATVRSPTRAQWGTRSDAQVIVAAAAKMAASDRSMYRRRALSRPLVVCSANSTVLSRSPKLTRAQSATCSTPCVNAACGSVEAATHPGPRRGLEPGLLAPAPQQVVDLRWDPGSAGAARHPLGDFDGGRP